MATDAELFKGCTDTELEVFEKLLEIRERRLEFAQEHHLNTRGERMDFSHFPHIRDVYNTTAKHLVLQGSVQSFKSEWAVIDQFACAYTGMSIFFVVPKYDMRNTYVQNRIDRAVETVPEYKRIIGTGFFDSVAIKNFGRGVIKYVGSNVLADFKEFPADMIFVEEVDECCMENLEYAVDRMRASRYQFTRHLGNPREKCRGINAFFLKSDQREWTVPCLKCGEYSELDWFEVVVEAIRDKMGDVVDYVLRDKTWEPGCRRDIKCICSKCGGELERASDQGRWVAKNPESMIEGYHISMMCSLLNNVAGMWDRFHDAIHDPGALQHFYNSDLGLPFEGSGNKLTSHLLDLCVEPGYQFVIDAGCAHISDDRHDGPCAMGVDVGGNFDVSISTMTGRGIRKILYVGKVRLKEDLIGLIDRYNVQMCVVDSMPELVFVQELQDEAVDHNCDVWACRYAGEGKDKRKTYAHADRAISIDRTEALDRSFATYKKRKVILPENYHAILGGQFEAEMTYPIRQTIFDVKGNTRYEWTKGKDHSRHSDTYNMLAFVIILEQVLDTVYTG